MSRFLNPMYASLAPYQPGEQPQGQNFIKLNTNENPYPPSPLVAKAVNNEIEWLQLYNDPTSSEVTMELARTLGVTPEQVMITNGSDEALAFIFQGLCPQGAVFADITYGFYPVYCQLYGVRPYVIPLREGFVLEPKDYYHGEGTVVLANPNAPTGLALSLKQIDGILSENVDNLVVVDEAYVDFGAETAVPLLKQYDNLMVVGTFSKSRSMAGARLGYVVSNPSLISDLQRIRFSFNPYNVNRMTQAAAIAALKDSLYFENCCKKIIDTRENTLETLERFGFETTDSEANFVFVRHPEIPGEILYKMLREEGILVRWFNLPRISNYLRISVGTDEQMNGLFCALEKIVNKTQ